MGELSDGSYTSFLSLDCCLIFTVNSANLCLISEVTLTKMHAGVESKLFVLGFLWGSYRS